MSADTGLEVKAYQWLKDGDEPRNIVRYYPYSIPLICARCGVCNQSMTDHGLIDFGEAGLVVCPGDWIISTEEGNFFPCKSEIFAEYSKLKNSMEEMKFAGKVGTELLKSCGERIEALERALIWCSNTDDFQKGGNNRQGWIKICQPLLDSLRIMPDGG